jgi:hypothetical protein
VKAVIARHLGAAAAANADYVSITAEGASIATMGAMATYAGNDSAFDGVSGLERVDLVDNIAYDSVQASPQLGSQSPTQTLPSVLFYENVVNSLAIAGKPLEFNYYTRFDTAKLGNNNFFSTPQVGKSALFDQHYKAANKNAGKVFSYFNPKSAPNAQSRNYTSLYISDKPTLLALTSVNDFVNPGSGANPYVSGAPGAGAYQINKPPMMRDSYPRILNGEVPDHAAIISNKPSNSALLELISQRQKLVGEGGSINDPKKGSKLYYFWNFLYAFAAKSQTDICMKQIGAPTVLIFKAFARK